jgi:hypothetical protein
VPQLVRERVEAAFADEDEHAFGERYLDHVLERWTGIEAALRRNVLLIVLLVVAFLLLEGGETSEFSLGPFKVTDVSSVLTLVPAVVSFLYYEWAELISARGRYALLRYEVFRKLHPVAHEKQLGAALAPPTISVWGDHPWERLRYRERGRAYFLLEKCGMVVTVGILLGAIAFPIYAYATLFEDSQTDPMALTLSLVFTLFNLARTAFTIADQFLAVEPDRFN